MFTKPISRVFLFIYIISGFKLLSFWQKVKLIVLLWSRKSRNKHNGLIVFK